MIEFRAQKFASSCVFLLIDENTKRNSWNKIIKLANIYFNYYERWRYIHMFVFVQIQYINQFRRKILVNKQFIYTMTYVYTLYMCMCVCLFFLFACNDVTLVIRIYKCSWNTIICIYIDQPKEERERERRGKKRRGRRRSISKWVDVSAHKHT